LSKLTDTMDERLTKALAQKQLAAAKKEFFTLFEHGTLQVEYYKPDMVDRQQPHTRDEVYVIASGSGIFSNGGVRRPFETGEVLFVPAGVEHRFEDFTDNFATWVFFYGPEGGEAATSSQKG
jgi:mannose-6-phosphate isomerase-like protein (cupin superfamily)